MANERYINQLEHMAYQVVAQGDYHVVLRGGTPLGFLLASGKLNLVSDCKYAAQLGSFASFMEQYGKFPALKNGTDIQLGYYRDVRLCVRFNSDENKPEFAIYRSGMAERYASEREAGQAFVRAAGLAEEEESEGKPNAGKPKHRLRKWLIRKLSRGLKEGS